MAARCATETLRNGEGVKELETRLDWAMDFVAQLQVLGRSAQLRHLCWKRTEELTDAEKKIVERAQCIVWARKDPSRSFLEGQESIHYYDGDKDEIRGELTRYLERPWARHPTVDCNLLDMMLTREACAFGEEVKMRMLPGPKDWLGMHPATSNTTVTCTRCRRIGGCLVSARSSGCSGPRPPRSGQSTRHSTLAMKALATS
jgi:hypothetical protein